MDIYLLILLCSVSIAIIGGIGAFIWQLILSRDKQLNETAQLSALEKEGSALESIREQVANTRRYDAHYQVLRDNHKAIRYIDKKIDAIIKQKAEYLKQYGAMVQEETAVIAQHPGWVDRIQQIDGFRTGVNVQIRQLDQELQLLQRRRSELWGESHELQTELIQEETHKNQTLDGLYSQHTDLLEKFYLGHASRVDTANQASIDAGTNALRYSLFAPVEAISRLWGGGQVRVTDPERIPHEIMSRQAVREVQNGINSVASNTALENNGRHAADNGLATQVA